MEVEVICFRLKNKDPYHAICDFMVTWGEAKFILKALSFQKRFKTKKSGEKVFRDYRVSMQKKIVKGSEDEKGNKILYSPFCFCDAETIAEFYSKALDSIMDNIVIDCVEKEAPWIKPLQETADS